MLTHIHPSQHPFTCRIRPIFNGTVNPGPESGAVQGPPGAQSSFARTRRYLVRRGVSHPVRGHYPSFIAPTSSCVRPHSSPWLRFSIPRGLCRLSSVPAARWSFPTLSLRVFPSMLGPLPRRCARCLYPLLLRHHRPSPSPHGSATRNNPLSDFRVGVISRLQSVLTCSGLEVCCHPGRSHRRVQHGAAVAFTSEQNTGRYLPVHRIC
jgi:hypothetical protein